MRPRPSSKCQFCGTLNIVDAEENPNHSCWRCGALLTVPDPAYPEAQEARFERLIR